MLVVLQHCTKFHYYLQAMKDNTAKLTPYQVADLCLHQQIKLRRFHCLISQKNPATALFLPIIITSA